MKGFVKAFVCAVLALGFLACSNDEVVSDTEIGLRSVELENEVDVNLPEYEFSKTMAGESERIERAYENAPPMIPHDIEGLLPITPDNNACLGCHDPAVAEAVGATALPHSHLFDMQKQVDLAGVMSSARYNCVACHTPQANINPTVANTFSPTFRDENSKGASNLLDVINEGVK